MIASQKRARFRSLLASRRSVVLAGAHDGLGARLVEEARFDAVWASGLEIAASYALPDESLLGLAEHLDAATRIDRATALPVIADADTGFGDTANAVHAVREYERAGITGVCIEDKQFPKRNSLGNRPQRLAPIDEFVAKIRAAKMAQSDPAFIVVARTEAFIVGEGLEAALARGHAYEAAGADLLVVHTKRPDTAELAAFGARWDGGIPLVAIPTTVPTAAVPELHRLGYQAVIFANHGLRAAIPAMRSALTHIAREERSAAVEPLLAPIGDVFALQRVEEWAAVGSPAAPSRDPAANGTGEGSVRAARPAADRDLLFNPGPTNVHEDVRRALLVGDTCHREEAFAAVLAGLDDDLVRVLGGEGTHVSIPFVSSGTGANEAILASVNGTLLVLVAGAYSARVARMARRLGIETTTLEFDRLEGVDVAVVERELATTAADVTHLFVVHLETTTGVLAPLRELGELCASKDVLLAMDGISSVGGHPFHLQDDGVAFCSLSANKCLESVPGLSFVLARRDVLETLGGQSRSEYFDLHAQWRSLTDSGTTRFTTATQLVRAARAALDRLIVEGYDRRVERYARLRGRLLDGVMALGLTPVPIPAGNASNLHVLVHQPAGLSYRELHDALLERGIVIYSDEDTIARGHVFFATMGAIDDAEVEYFLRALEEVLHEARSRSAVGAVEAR